MMPWMLLHVMFVVFLADDAMDVVDGEEEDHDALELRL